MAKVWMCANGHEAPKDGSTECGVCGESFQWMSRTSDGVDPASSDSWVHSGSAWGRIWGGLVLSVVGWFVVVLAVERDSVFGLLGGGVVGFVGAALTSIGVIAEGVRLGLELRQRD